MGRKIVRGYIDTCIHTQTLTEVLNYEETCITLMSSTQKLELTLGMQSNHRHSPNPIGICGVLPLYHRSPHSKRDKGKLGCFSFGV